MVKFTIAFRAPPGMSREECQDYYRNSHGPLVSSVPEFLRHVRSYSQNFVLNQYCYSGDGAVIDGISELQFDNWEAYNRAFSESKYLELIRPDEKRFADLSSVLVMFSEECKIYDSGSPADLKYFRLLFRDARTDSELFKNIWHEKYASAIKNNSSIRQFSSMYIQNRLSDNDKNPFSMSSPLSGIDEFRLESEEQIPALLEEESRVFHSFEMASVLDNEATMETVCRTNEVLKSHRS